MSLPEIAEVFENAGYRVVTDQTTQTALKAVTTELKTGPVPVLVSNVGPAALLRTGTRRAASVNGDVPVVVVVLEDGYTDFIPDRARAVHAPCSVNDLLDALDLPRDPSFDALQVDARGSITDAGFAPQSTNDTTYDNSDASGSVEDRVTVEPSGESAASVHEPEVSVPPVPSIPEVPAVPSVDVVAQSHDEVDARAPQAPQVPDVPPVPQVASVPVVSAEDAVAPEPESAVKVEDALAGVPADVIARAAEHPGEWVLQYDNSGEQTTESALGAWYSGPDGVVVPEFYEPNPRYVPVERRARANDPVPPLVPDVPTFEEATVASEVPADSEDEDEFVEFESDDVEPSAPSAVLSPEPVPALQADEPVESPLPPVVPSVPEPVTAAEPLYEDRYEPTTFKSVESPLTVERDDSYLDVRKRPHGKGDVVIVWGAKGGVGKTTTALNLAQRAAASGLRVVLVDGNFGQGDIRQYLRLAKANIPSIHDAAISRELKDAFVGPDTINYYRPDGLDDIKFVYVAAPPEHLADISVVTPELYAAIIAESTHFADLVVVDTQIIETIDTSGMVTRLIEPLLQENAWGVGVSDLSAPGMANLFKKLERFENEGVPSSRMMTLLNRVNRDAKFNEETLGKTLSRNSKFLGTVYQDSEIESNMNLGRTAVDVLALFPMLDTILSTITGQQPPSVNLTSPAPGKKRKRGLFGRKGKK